MSRPAAIAIAAHPDDIEFTMAGSRARIQQLASEGRFEEIRREQAALFGSTDTKARARLVSVGGIDVSANVPK